MVHSETQKTEIVNCLNDTYAKTNTKVVIYTSAFGMGLFCLNAGNVSLFGLPENIVDIVQEIGHIGT